MIMDNKRYQEQCIKEARAIYRADKRKDAVKEYTSWAEKWEAVSPVEQPVGKKPLKEFTQVYTNLHKSLDTACRHLYYDDIQP